MLFISYYISILIIKLTLLFLYSFIAIAIWNVTIRPLLIEKVFSLILVFFLLSFWLLLNGLEFLPLVILLLYIGAISVLFLFVVIILNPDFLFLIKQKKELVNLLLFQEKELESLFINKFLIKYYPKQFYTKLNKLLSLHLQDVKIKNTSNPIYLPYYTLLLLIYSFFSAIVSWYQFFAIKKVIGHSTFVISIIIQNLSLFDIEYLHFKLNSYYSPFFIRKYRNY